MNISSENNSEVVYRISPTVSNEELSNLFAHTWNNHEPTDFRPVLERSLAYICAYNSKQLIGFVNLAWDGGVHAFILDTIVHSEFRRRGVGINLVRQAAKTAKEYRIEWLHVDFAPHLQEFYDKCGFRKTNAGLINLTQEMAE